MSSESSSRDRNSEPLRRGPRARAARRSSVPPDSTDGVLGKWTGFSGASFVLAHGIPGLAQGSKGEGRETGRSNASLTNQPTETRERQQHHPNPTQNSICNIRPFCSPGLRPSLRLGPRPVPCSTPLRGISRKVSKGGVPPPWPRHTAYPPIGRRCATPPLLIQYDDDPEEDSGGSNSSGS